MGRLIDENKPLSDTDREYLISRGRGWQVEENDRRFGLGGTAETSPELESEGSPADSASFDTELRSEAEYDVGGAPLPGTYLNRDTGRVVPISHRTDPVGEIDPQTGEPVDSDDNFDDDIIEEVDSLTVAELKDQLKSENISFDDKLKKVQLADKLIVARQDKRNAEKKVQNPQGIDPNDSLAFSDPAKTSDAKL